MADEVDRANDEAERSLAEALMVARKGVRLLPDGCCHWCDDNIAPRLLFCGLECRDEWQRHDEAKRRNGSWWSSDAA